MSIFYLLVTYNKTRVFCKTPILGGRTIALGREKE